MVIAQLRTGLPRLAEDHDRVRSLTAWPWIVSVRPKTPFFWKTGRLTFECNMRVSCFDVRKAKFFSCCEWEREFRQFVDEQIRMITKVMPVTKPAFVFS